MVLVVGCDRKSRGKGGIATNTPLFYQSFGCTVGTTGYPLWPSIAKKVDAGLESPSGMGCQEKANGIVETGSTMPFAFGPFKLSFG